MTKSEKLFSYGTLQYQEVQLATFGRLLTGQKDVLPHYVLTILRITDPKVVALSKEADHPMLKYTGNDKDTVAGMVFDITPEELAQADAYEVDSYKRISVTLDSGVSAWVYANASDC